MKISPNNLMAILAGLGAFILPIKLGPAYIFLGLALAIYLIYYFQDLINFYKNNKVVALPALAYVFAVLCSVVYGVDPYNSFKALISPCIMILVAIPFFSYLRASDNILIVGIAVIIGQSIAALHTIIEGFVPNLFISLSQGPVTESGQIVLVIFLALGIAIYINNRYETVKTKNSILITTLLGTACLTLLGFSKTIGLSLSAILVLTAACGLFILFGLFKVYRKYSLGEKNYSILLFLLLTALPILTAALLINLKRGPWFGVLIGLIVLLWKLKPRLNLLFITLSSIFAIGIIPIRDRILSAGEHFFIYGGRSELWDLGLELMVRFPLGIGYENSRLIRNFTHNIPSFLNHFHNNIINVTVELGWLGLVAYCWWMLSLILKGLFKPNYSPEGLLSYTLACGILAWQIAGSVEYNFGDSEVFLVSLILIGFLSYQSNGLQNKGS